MNIKKVASAFIWSSLGLTSCFLLSVYLDGYIFWGGSSIKYDVTGQVGDFIGGVVGTIISAAGFYFLYLTFQEQRNSFEKERLESKFFDLIKLHRDNVGELSFDAKDVNGDGGSLLIEKRIYIGKSVFNVIFDQYVMCSNELKLYFNTGTIYKSSYLKKLMQESYIVENNISLPLLAKIDICYNIVFYGVGAEGILILKHVFKERYNTRFIDDILEFISLKPANENGIFAKWQQIMKKNSLSRRKDIVKAIYDYRRSRPSDASAADLDIATEYHNRYVKFYGGHQFRLGHYYRHLFQTINFINNQTNLDYKAKYEYVKILRAQLSTYEQALLFLNSLSRMGEAWELHPESNKSFVSSRPQDFQLISKYNMIKNLPGETIYGVPFKLFFPLVNYESNTNTVTRPKYT